ETPTRSAFFKPVAASQRSSQKSISPAGWTLRTRCGNSSTRRSGTITGASLVNDLSLILWRKTTVIAVFPSSSDAASIRHHITVPSFLRKGKYDRGASCSSWLDQGEDALG